MANNKRTTNDGKLSKEEAGRQGGQATSNNHDQEFYQEIGKKGGESSKSHTDSDTMSRQEAGRKGGQTRAKNNNSNNTTNTD